MRGRRGLLILFGVVVVLMVLANQARQSVIQKPLVNGDHVVFKDDYRLSGTVNDALFVVAQTITLTGDSHVTGDAALVGSSVTVDGQIDGDLTVTGGQLTLGPQSVVRGDLLVIGSGATINGRVDGDLAVTGGKLTMSPDAQVKGEMLACVQNVDSTGTIPASLSRCGDANVSAFADLLRLFRGHSLPVEASASDFTVVGLLSSAFISLVLCGLAALAVTLFPRQISHIEEAIRVTPRHLIVHGLMTFLFIVGVGSGFIVLLAAVPPLGIALLPVLFICVVLFLGMVLAGFITLTIVFGEWLLRRATLTAGPPIVTAAVGSVTLTLLLHLIAFIPYGALVSLLILAFLSAFAVGAALSTRMGTRPMRRSYFVQG
jgi:cytoskeletal protein CcmA (bactofilin family)